MVQEWEIVVSSWLRDGGEAVPRFVPHLNPPDHALVTGSEIIKIGWVILGKWLHRIGRHTHKSNPLSMRATTALGKNCVWQSQIAFHWKHSFSWAKGNSRQHHGSPRCRWYMLQSMDGKPWCQNPLPLQWVIFLVLTTAFTIHVTFYFYHVCILY